MTVVIGADILAAELTALAARSRVAERKLVAHYGALYRTRVRARASGRPGPRAITGDYRRSITLELRGGGGSGALNYGSSGTTAEIYTNRPQARRLEYGFMNMTDSLGRTFRQPPYPHFEPDLQRTVDEMMNALATAIGVAS